MIANINGIRVEGTPEEIARFKQLYSNSNNSNNGKRPVGDPYGIYDENGEWEGDL